MIASKRRSLVAWPARRSAAAKLEVGLIQGTVRARRQGPPASRLNPMQSTTKFLHRYSCRCIEKTDSRLLGTLWRLAANLNV